MELWRQPGKMKTFAANAVAGAERLNTVLLKYRRRGTGCMVSINEAQCVGDWRGDALVHADPRRTWKRSMISAACQTFLRPPPVAVTPAA
jgi:hypothetical protein